MLELLGNAVAIGVAYALLGLGFTLIFGVMRRFNLAFGPTILVGVYVTALIHLAWPGRLWLAVAAGLATTLAGGLYVERLCFAPLRAEPPYASMVSTFAVWMQLQDAVALTTRARTTPFLADIAIPGIGWRDVQFRGEVVLMAGGACALAVSLFFVLYRTAYGRAVRAVTDDAEAAALMGVNVNRLALSAFLLASAVGGTTGLLIALSHRQVAPYFGLWATVKGLTAMMLGSPGSLMGAAIGGLVLGLAEVAALWHLGGEYRDAVAYALLLAAIAWRARHAAFRDQAV